ncbi:MAG TPA: response regulator [Gemmata sp.]|nr:response regulator [Gemmata sp.]
MLAPTLATDAAEPDSTPPTEPDDEPGVETLLRLKQAAAKIVNRVRQTLTPQGFVPLRVLVVDDHPDAAESLTAVLELLECPARACLDGQTALAAAKQFRPQVCLLDLMMPGMDGLELASRLKAWAMERPLLLVATTALADTETRVKATIAGFHDYLIKPVSIPDLIDVLARMGKYLSPPDHPNSAPA